MGWSGLIAGWRLRLIRPTGAEEKAHGMERFDCRMAAAPYPAYGAEEKATGMERLDCRMAAVPYPAYEGRGKGYWDGAV